MYAKTRELGQVVGGGDGAQKSATIMGLRGMALIPIHFVKNWRTKTTSMTSRTQNPFALKTRAKLQSCSNFFNQFKNRISKKCFKQLGLNVAWCYLRC